MLSRISRHGYAMVAPRLTGFDHQLSVAAVLGAAMPGEVFADDPLHPGAAVVHCAEGTFVGGNPAVAGLVAQVRDHLAGVLAPGSDQDLVLSFAHEGWSVLAPALAPGLTCVAVPRRHYLYQAGHPRKDPHPPPGYRIAPIDAALLKHPQVPGHLRRWMASNWGDEDGFLAGGFGAVARYGEIIASWSLADCVIAGRAEIGIHTAPEHRRRGLATAVTAAAVAIAIDRRLTQVGWHCNDDNPGSYRTAETAGFTLHRRYQFFAYRH